MKWNTGKGWKSSELRSFCLYRLEMCVAVGTKMV